MKKIIAFVAGISLLAFAAFAGDAAFFEDLGFSEDGSVYVFGQYGKTDKDFQAWAEIYTVNVAKNDFVKNENYKLEPGTATVSLSGKKAWEKLSENTEWKLAKYKLEAADPENYIYVSETDKKDPEDEIVFKDYEASTKENPVYYHIRLCPTYEGFGSKSKSSFYINLEQVDGEGTVLMKHKVGTPSVKRPGVTGYKIVKIFTDKSGKSLVFVVEKTTEDEKGTSIRYMVETIRLK